MPSSTRPTPDLSQHLSPNRSDSESPQPTQASRPHRPQVMSPQAGREVIRSPPVADNCCGYGCFIKIWKMWHVTDPDSPSRNPQLETQYQAPVVTPPTAALALRTYDDEGLEQRRLLPKWSESSGGLRGEGVDGAGIGNTSGAQMSPLGPPTSLATGPLGLPVGQHPEPQLKSQHRRTGSNNSDMARHSATLQGHRTSRHQKGPSFSASEPAGKGSIQDVLGAGQVGSTPDDDDDSNYCPTCLEAYTTDNPKTFTSCGHHYHLPCLYEWLERKDTCPICESPLNFPGMG